ncbi:MAG: hypothetical protein ACE5F1_22250 [Planctomycetota bacterium]
MPAQELDLETVRELYERGRFVQAYQAGPGSLESWQGTEARLLAGRLAIMLGAPRLGTALHMSAWRGDREDPEAVFYHVCALLGRRGPWEAWQALKRATGAEGERAELWALRGRLLGCFRDFDAAEDCLGRAEELDGQSPWIRVERSWLLQQEDRYEDALLAARAALELKDWYGPAVLLTGHLLQLLDRDGEARSFLEEGLAHTENSAVAAQLILLQKELGASSEALATLDRYAELTPLLEKKGRAWLDAMRGDLAYATGDLAEAARLAARVGEPFYEKIAERVRNGGRAGKRVMPLGLPLGKPGAAALRARQQEFRVVAADLTSRDGGLSVTMPSSTCHGSHANAPASRRSPCSPQHCWFQAPLLRRRSAQSWRGSIKRTRPIRSAAS